MSGDKPTLTDARGMGGVNALDGFDYQVWEGLARLPAWLRHPAFEGMIFEGLEDFEARFFAPHAPQGHVVDRFQAKSGAPTPDEVRGVFRAFEVFENAYPNTARTQTLITPRLPSSLSWLAKDAARVARARPFYAPFAEVVAASAAKLIKDLVEALGPELARFVIGHVDVIERPATDRDAAIAVFGVALGRAFPNAPANGPALERAFAAVEALARRKKGALLSRAELLAVLTPELGQFEPASALPIHVRSDRNGADETALEIDASAFSGGASGFPDAAVWAEGLLAPLDRTARWLRQRGASRAALGGSYRLTTAFVLGWSFRSATGFELDIPTRYGGWATDDRGAPDLASGWRVEAPLGLAGDRLIVAIGVLRDPVADLQKQIGSSPILRAQLDAPLTSASMAQAGVSLLRKAVGDAASQLRPSAIDLYFAGPAALAVALGHRWNALPPTQLHEFLAKEGTYVPTATLG
jgi:hypothetical protein